MEYKNLVRVIKSRRGCVHAMQSHSFETKLPSLKLKTMQIKLQLTEVQNLGRVIKSRKGCVHTMQSYSFETKLPSLKLKT
jgi:hypothetical protein